MAKLNDQERWDKWMVQAQDFAKREKYLEAIARSGLVINEVSAAVDKASEGRERNRLERVLKRAERRREIFQAAFDEWNSAIARRRALATQNAAEEMARPLPLPKNELI